MIKDHSTWLENLAESDEFADYILDNLPRETVEALFEKFAEMKLNKAGY